MEKVGKKEGLKAVLEVVGRFTEGVSLEQIMLALSPLPTRRTVQRWVTSLIERGEVVAQGEGRARRYCLAKPIKGKMHPLPSLIPLSREGAHIQSLVAQPIQMRHPVSYNREFLESYIPNQTQYLSEGLKSKLRSMGQGIEENYLAGTYAHQIFQRLLIDLSWNSSRLEGNTYSLLETERLIELGKAPAGKNIRETQMILNHKAAIEFLIHSVRETGISRYTILNLHTLLSDNLMSDPAACGRLRFIPVAIGKSVYQPSAIPQVVEECFDLLIQKAKEIRDPFEQAFFLMVQLPYLQPFDDVNKRTSRLAANIPLIQRNLCPLSFIDVPEEIYINGLLGVYELNRIELLRDVFEWAYLRSCNLYSTARKSLGEPDPFRMKYREEMRELVAKIVRMKSNKIEAISVIRKTAEHQIVAEDRDRFIEMIERELQGLHEGNIARYQLRPEEYRVWKGLWV